MRQLNRKLQGVEGDKGALQRKVDDAEHALRTAIKDRDVLIKYITNVGNALEAVRWLFSFFSKSEFMRYYCSYHNYQIIRTCTWTLL